MYKVDKIIIMDDDMDYANFIADVFKTLDLDCTVITNPDEFMKRFDLNVFLVFLDLNIPGINGIDLLRFIERKHGECDIVLMSGVEDRILEAAEAFAQSINLSIVGRFQKTIRLAELEDLLKKLTLSKAPRSEQPTTKAKIEFTATLDELTRAVKNNEFVVYYQPKIEIATRGFYGVEALVRWLLPNQRLIFPDQFISQAESFGLIDKLTWLIMKNALRDIGELQNKLQFPFKLALNLSPFSLKDLEFPNQFNQLVEQSSLSADKIIIEITESGLIKELSSALEIFTRLRLNKVQLSIDDFGTGYAMMQQLKIIPASELKIDKSLCRQFDSVSGHH
ncbi:Bacteriophytochrome cph2 [Legionella massiliensis]|uniref:Bacteriophytochrome cph2 n=1 Tax=Legionella massiliensis TaxID=1034943 RepID=A0A078KZJ0_9GAMM|nr:EAL domain-containing response regulator [Legionella massiliensis]CDZ77209.1 Bacteriophytochrome cph2 [Legionella massiliensis]CEE12947.1 Phytochrome-like protein cph2 [Legionella massiliensis]